MFRIGIARQVSKEELTMNPLCAEGELFYLIESNVLRYTMMNPAPFPDWYERRLETVIDRLQVKITDSPDHRSLLIAGFIELDDDEYVPESKQLTEKSASANARDYVDSLDERYDVHIRKMISNESYEQYSNAIKQALESNTGVEQIVKISKV